MNIQSMRNYLRRVGWIYGANAKWKAISTKRVYRKTTSYYMYKVQRRSFKEQLHDRLGNRLEKIRCLNRPINIFFLGTNERQDRAGTIQGLKKFGEVTYFTRTDGSYGHSYPGDAEVIRHVNSSRLWYLFRQLSERGRTPDILIGQTRGRIIDPSILSRIRDEFGTIVINISMDDRHQYWGVRRGSILYGTYPLIPHIDIALTAAPECVGWYLKEDCPALFFPEASSPDIFHPMSGIPKIHDVCFVGGCYGVREKIVKAIEASGVGVAAFGHGWPNGVIETDQIPELFARSLIVLGVGTIGHCTDFYALKMRDFDGPISGSLYLTHHNPDLEKLYIVGEEIETYHTIEDCVNKVKYYLEHPDEADKIGMSGRRRAKKDHTWECRFEKMLITLGILSQVRSQINAEA